MLTGFTRLSNLCCLKFPRNLMSIPSGLLLIPRGLVLIGGSLLAEGVWALGLGNIEATSVLGQPLKASIQVIDTSSQSRTRDLLIRKVSSEEAQNLGFELVSPTVGIQLTPIDTAQGVVINVHSIQTINEPFINFLVELQWPSGTVYREYTVLLDLPAVHVTTSPDRVASQARSNTPATAKPAGQPAKIQQTSYQTSQTTAVKGSGEPGKASSTSSSKPSLNTSDGRYRVQRGDNLSAIAANWSQGTDESLQTATQWLFQHNPQAFVRGDINQLKAGVLLTMPSSADLPLQLNDNLSNTASSNTASSNMASNNTAPDPAAKPAASTTVASSSVNRPREVNESLNKAHQIVAAQNDSGLNEKAGGLLRIAQAGLISESELSDRPEGSDKKIQAHIETTREVVDQLQRDNEDLRRQVSVIENSEYLNSLNKLIALQEEQIAELRALQSEDSNVASSEASASNIAASSATAGLALVAGGAAADNKTSAALVLETGAAPSSTPLAESTAPTRASLMDIAAPVMAGQPSFSLPSSLMWFLTLGLPLLVVGFYAAFVQKSSPRREEIGAGSQAASPLPSRNLPVIDVDESDMDEPDIDEETMHDMLELELDLEDSNDEQGGLVPVLTDNVSSELRDSVSSGLTNRVSSGAAAKEIALTIESLDTDKLVDHIDELDIELDLHPETLEELQLEVLDELDTPPQVEEYKDLEPLIQGDIEDDLEEFLNRELDILQAEENQQIANKVLPFERPQRRSDEEVKQSILEKTQGYKPSGKKDEQYLVQEDSEDIDDYLNVEFHDLPNVNMTDKRDKRDKRDGD